MTLGRFIDDFCYEGISILITGVGPDSDEYFEGQTGWGDIPNHLLESEFYRMFVRDGILVMECEYSAK